MNWDRERQPYISELGYFAANPNVAGMMTEDQRVILQPGMPYGQANAVYKNELARLLMQDYQPKSRLTDQQKQFFTGTPYERQPANALLSVFARGLTGDPSANLSFEQDRELRGLTSYGGLLGGMGGGLLGGKK